MSGSEVIATFVATAAHGWDVGSTFSIGDNARLDAVEIERRLREELSFPISVNVTRKEDDGGTCVAVTRLADE